MEPYTLGLFANMYPTFDGDFRGIFIQQMVKNKIYLIFKEN